MILNRLVILSLSVNLIQYHNMKYCFDIFEGCQYQTNVEQIIVSVILHFHIHFRYTKLSEVLFIFFLWTQNMPTRKRVE